MSEFRFVTFVLEPVWKGGCPLATFRPSALAAVAVLVFVILRARSAIDAVRELGEMAVFACPRMKFPPVAA